MVDPQLSVVCMLMVLRTDGGGIGELDDAGPVDVDAAGVGTNHCTIG